MPSSVPLSASPPHFEAFNATSLMCLICWTFQQNNFKVSHKKKKNPPLITLKVPSDRKHVNILILIKHWITRSSDSAGSCRTYFSFSALSPISLWVKDEWLMKEIIIWAEMRRIKLSHVVPKFCVVSCCILLALWLCCLKKTRQIGYHYSLNSSFEHFWFFFKKLYNLKCVTVFELSSTFLFQFQLFWEKQHFFTPKVKNVTNTWLSMDRKFTVFFSSLRKAHRNP